MIKINHLDDKTMDLVMGLSRESKLKPDEVIKTLLSNINYEEAKRAIIYGYKKDYEKATRK